MKNSKTASASGHAIAACPISQGCLAALLAGLLSVSLPVALSRAQPANDDEGGAEVLTRGPVHEAFAGVVSYNPEPGIVVPTAPPELIEEIPPEEKPEGDDVAWIPGYWGWDDERNDYIWISGTWRAVPPGREWMAGYWRDTGQGYQWISGYWADANEQETAYLPPPPMTLEVGANIDAPSLDYGWTPGCWVWHQDRYAWRAGYWTQGRADWVWIPAYYVWTPRGVIFVEGFWDYPVERRGLLFAPVYYQSHRYARRGYSYSPRIVINLSVFTDHLFLRPSYHHYYFGDYYGPRYDQGGFYASFSYQSSRFGYDPFYSHSRWEHRQDRGWENRFQAAYRDRRQNEAARPPRTWAAQATINTRPAAGGQARIMMAAPLEQLATRKDNPVRFQPVGQGDRQRLTQRGREVQQSREQRRTVEAKGAVTTGRNAGGAIEPAKVAAPRSPIVAKPAGQRGKNQAPPKVQQAPRPDLNVQPKAEAPDRRPDADQRASPAGARQPAPDRQASRDRRTPGAGETPAQPATEQRANAAAANDREESQRKSKEAQMRAQQDTEKRTKDAAVKAEVAEKAQQEERATAAKGREEPRRKEQPTQLKAPQEAERRNQEEKAKTETAARAQQQNEERARASADKAQEESQRKAQQAQQQANESAAKANQEREQRAQADAARVRQESQRNEQQAQMRAQQEAERRNQEEKGKAEAAARAQQQQETGERTRASAARAQEESQRNAQQAQMRAQQEAAKRDQDAAAKAEAARARQGDKEKPAEDKDAGAKNESDKSR